MHPFIKAARVHDVLPSTTSAASRVAVATGLQDVIEQQHEKSRQLFAGQVLSQLTINCD